MTEATKPDPGTIVRYYDGEGNEGFLLVHDTFTREEPNEMEDYGADPEWVTVIDIDGWSFRPGHDGSRWVEKVPNVDDPELHHDHDPYWRPCS